MDMKIKCKINGHICELPDSMVDFFVHTTVIYCGTLSPTYKPHIHPVIFIIGPFSRAANPVKIIRKTACD